MTEPASVVFWNLSQAGGDYTFLEACATLELAYGTSGSQEALRVELGSRRLKAGESAESRIRPIKVDVSRLPGGAFGGCGAD